MEKQQELFVYDILLSNKDKLEDVLLYKIYDAATKPIELHNCSLVSHSSRCNFSIAGISSDDANNFKTIHIIKDGELQMEAVSFGGCIYELKDLPLFSPVSESSLEDFLELTNTVNELSENLKVMRRVKKGYELDNSSTKEESPDDILGDSEIVEEEPVYIYVPCVTYEAIEESASLVCLNEEDVKKAYPDLISLKEAISLSTKSVKFLRFCIRGLSYSFDKSDWMDKLLLSAKMMPRSKKKELRESLSVPYFNSSYLIRRVSWTDRIKL